jgi:putative FmdB family regulatory protein
MHHSGRRAGEEDAMPLYEYRCQACGTQEEKLEPISAPDSHDCPECEAPAGMKRQLSVAAFSLSGGGWYKQGYSGAPGKPEAAAEGPGGGEAGRGGTGKTGGGCAESRRRLRGGLRLPLTRGRNFTVPSLTFQPPRVGS